MADRHLWGNALIFAIAGVALLLSAELGRMLGGSAAGRKALRRAPVLTCLVLSYVGLAFLSTAGPPAERCIYNSEHPSDC